MQILTRRRNYQRKPRSGNSVLSAMVQFVTSSRRLPASIQKLPAQPATPRTALNHPASPAINRINRDRLCPAALHAIRRICLDRFNTARICRRLPAVPVMPGFMLPGKKVSANIKRLPALHATRTGTARSPHAPTVTASRIHRRIMNVSPAALPAISTFTTYRPIRLNRSAKRYFRRSNQIEKITRGALTVTMHNGVDAPDQKPSEGLPHRCSKQNYAQKEV